ncbi:hydroxymethylpyrimidine/phosphomethylpyrimidine kinase [Catalinimonas alkaloidigena]|uniref:hydroxymethylpyrimidine kinase n=1 Tax=Catalinimonas alkaloidigena TaxID=1075417 RepID=A0A1G8XQ82_9BACT|nr:bifunctional hydroxymethylpyrimidine kinase/phosphomethylpyrimidine kinase [Catalinimonas alkaloidigena]SDJ92688.1 hydroxymethylpyrimidine/phosphomethylpyrimidine kinase [Catalinimonas alkaloidigena]
MKSTYPRVLTIAGSDSGGGAGIQADLKTFSALACYGMSCLTALTAQNTVGVTGIHAVPTEMVVQQLEAVFDDIGTDAVKIGMLFSAEIIEAVADTLKRYTVRNVVLDPVMVAKSGDHLLREEAILALKHHLLPLVDLVTPNLPEAEVLTGLPVKTLAEMEQAGPALLTQGSRAALVKGGHLESDTVTDLLFVSGEAMPLRMQSARIDTPNTHGTGCTLSSAIAAFLARGVSLEAAVPQARSYLTQALQAGSQYALGHGHGPVHHFHAWWS